MDFRVVKNKIVEILGDAAAGRFRVIGYRGQTKSQNEIKKNDRIVLVNFTDGQFPKNAGGRIGRKIHDITIDLELSTSAAAECDVRVLTDESAAPAAKALAISEIKEATEKADQFIDELIEYVYQILMDASNESLLLDKGTISNRWIDSIKKDAVLEHGSLIVKTALLKYTCRVSETVLGDPGTVPATVTIDSSITGDIPFSGVSVENDN